mmetsp:Transcript_5223/g.9828  ORF Transcript_5223/g.9828 Transcript_5223/m.9828 type:complete len:99 (-) Transcript_5223:122-418(-)
MGEGAVVGGFKAADTSSEEVKAAAHFAAEKLGKGPLVKVAEAGSQVVAGLNYRMVLHIAHDDEDSKPHSYLVKVHRPLPSAEDNNMQLSEQSYQGAVA